MCTYPKLPNSCYVRLVSFSFSLPERLPTTTLRHVVDWRQIDYDRSGRSKEMAMVIFRRREDAELAVSQFHKRTLDGAPMNVEIIEAADPPSRNGASRGDGVRGRGNGMGTGPVGGGMGNTWRGKCGGGKEGVRVCPDQERLMIYLDS